MVDSNVVELLTVKEALKLYVASRWASFHRLIIKNNSSNIVNWVLNPSKVPWFMKRHMAHIEIFKQQLLGCDVFSFREKVMFWLMRWQKLEFLGNMI